METIGVNGTKSFVKWSLLALMLALIAMHITGCAQMAGVKEYHKTPDGGTHILFTSATDFTVGWGQYDTADKRKSIQPGRGFGGGVREIRAGKLPVDAD